MTKASDPKGMRPDYTDHLRCPSSRRSGAALGTWHDVSLASLLLDPYGTRPTSLVPELRIPALLLRGERVYKGIRDIAGDPWLQQRLG